MTESGSAPILVPHPPGFRARRGLNWAFVGLLYTSFYMCRYNLSIANSAISGEFGFTKAQMGKIITTALLAYACGQIVNGLLADRFLPIFWRQSRRCFSRCFARPKLG